VLRCRRRFSDPRLKTRGKTAEAEGQQATPVWRFSEKTEIGTYTIIPPVLRAHLRQQILRYALATGVVFGIVLLLQRLHVNPTTAALVFLLAVLLTSTAWGLQISVYQSMISTLAFNYFFLPPIGTFTIADPHNWAALLVFLATALTAIRLSERARRRTDDANRRRSEIERLYAFARQLLVAGNVVELLNAVPRRIVEAFEVRDAALFLAGKDEIHRFGADSREDLTGERLRTVMARGEPEVDADRQVCFVPVQMGVRPVGSLGISGAIPSRETLEAVGTMTAIAIERASAVEALGKAEAAREEERLRTALLDSVAHELRTPLTGIKASITSLLTQYPQLDESQRQELYSVINEEADRLNRLVEEALEMARLDADGIELELAPHAIRDAIEAALEQCRSLLSNHAVEVRVSGDLPAVRFDFGRVKQVLMHLLENAAKYSAAGTKILISAEIAGDSLVTNVADRGVGIDGLEQALVFDKFYRGRDQRYQVRGTGMGLAICKAIVEAHGGKIGVTSQPGSGAVFYFTLPVARAEARA
jgi:two-component system, OmpR family, sensor histidine kinase KdpD